MAAGGDLRSIAAQPSFPSSELPDWDAISESAPDGARQSFLEVSYMMKDHELVYRGQTDAQKASFDTFWNDNNGSYHRFTVTHWIDSVAYDCYFDENVKYKPRKITAGTWEWAVRLLFVKP